MAHPRQLAELYQRVVHDELGLSATINEDHAIIFKHPEIGGVFVHFDAEDDPEYVEFVCPAFFDANRGVARDDLVRICNLLNAKTKLAILSVREDVNSSVWASVALILAPPEASPDEDLLRNVIGRVMASIVAAVEDFLQEIQTQTTAASV